MALKTRPQKTVDDYMKLSDDVRVELIEGQFFVTPSPTYRHQRLTGNLFVLLRAFVGNQNAGEICIAPLDVVLPSGEVVRPDVLFVSKERRGILQDCV